jgi:hypothetical protein
MKQSNSIKKCPRQAIYVGEADIIGLEKYLMVSFGITAFIFWGFQDSSNYI